MDISGAVLKFVPVEAGSRSLRDYLPVAGFSLLELMVVLAVMAVLAVMTLPALMGSSSERTLCREAEELSARLYRFRDLAMEQGRPWRAVFNPGRKTWSGFCDTDGDLQRGPGEPGLGPFSLGRGTSFGSDAGSGPNNTSLPSDGVSFQDNCITFSPMGSCSSGSIYLRNGKASVAVRVYPASAVVRVWVFRRNWENIK